MDSSQSSQTSDRHSTTPYQSKFSVRHMQLPQRPLPSHGSPSESTQSPVARLEPALISLPSKAEVVYVFTGEVVSEVVFHPSVRKNIVDSAGKDAGYRASSTRGDQM
jgi:hypothetical protein